MYLVMEKKRIITRWTIHISLQVRYRSRTVQVQVGGSGAGAGAAGARVSPRAALEKWKVLAWSLTGDSCLPFMYLDT